MSQSIQTVRGIGPAAAATLAESGITTVEDLAAKTPLQVAAIKGFNEIRATQATEQVSRYLSISRPAPRT